MNAISLSRRALVFSGLSVTGALVIGVPMQAKAGMQPPVMADGTNPAKEMTAFLVIEPDNTVTVRVPHAEMGQGTSTALAMLVAEELACDWAKVRVEYASANRNSQAGGNLYGRMQTVGSSGLRTSVSMMQQAGASARERLRLAAAEQWKIDPADCSVAAGKCVHKASNRSLDYGALAAAAAAVQLSAEPAIKTPDKYQLVGKWTPRLDTAAKLDGSAKFGLDAQVPGMVYAAVWSAPVFGGSLKSVDDVGLKDIRGIVGVVKLKDAVVVVADRYWRAKKGLDALKIEWDDGGYGAVDSETLAADYRAALDKPMGSAEKKGDAQAVLQGPGAKVVEAVYEAPLLSHSPMEPMNCTVALTPDRADVWISTQAPMAVLQQAAKEIGLKPEQVYVHNAFVGGGFGRRGGAHDELIQAIAVAKQVGKPVKLIWSREQDMRRDRYRPQAAVRFRTALDEAGKPQAFQAQIAVGSLLRGGNGPQELPASEPMATECIQNSFYAFPARDVGVLLKNSHVPVSFWRGVGSSQNGFFMEGFMDEVAYAAGQDPYKYRRALLTDRPDALGVIDALAKHSDWGQPLPKGRGRGIAIIEAYGSVSGQVVEVTVSKDGKLKVDRVTCVLDPYHVANPNTVEQQMEGAVIMGMTAALWGEINIKNGAPVEGNFNTYRMARMVETPPRIDVHLVPSGGPKWGGVGEPGLGPFAPALTSAIYAATGKRVRRLPLKHADLSWA
ncbi:molybdopterin cofactor-binding domain-containing protein [Phenylobacterium sp.]|uniref:xanthine dehydrogenase family protein molybdopterin-binding subunit n=1 Tax=Phenylobacterium sp. TaxID=1871053 RepID=UPI0012125701|nr:molybdopterin cofactor-binding domain-containing protein [Phenylobacterium sp.]THD51549.1 MAG: xanthine dehydrogenase family protein molybdopterin-binding subunit [Phenylobacterium sp.]